MYKRHITSFVLNALRDTPVVFLNGARQTGKSTLVQQLAANPHPARYLTMDDAGILAAARHDPTGFLSGLEGPVVLDEGQRVPELFLAIKAAVDRDRRPGRFLLTGSADVLLLPRVAELLVGRMEVLTLWPLSQGEILGAKEGFIDAIFAGPPRATASIVRCAASSRIRSTTPFGSRPATAEGCASGARGASGYCCACG